MDKKTRKTLLIIGAIEAIVLIFCFVVSVIVWATIGRGNENTYVAVNGPFIGFFQTNPTAFFCLIVLPLFVIFVVDGVYLIVYATKKQSMVTQEEKDAIQEEARRQAREEVMKELQAKKDVAAKKDDK